MSLYFTHDKYDVRIPNDLPDGHHVTQVYVFDESVSSITCSMTTQDESTNQNLDTLPFAFHSTNHSIYLKQHLSIGKFLVRLYLMYVISANSGSDSMVAIANCDSRVKSISHTQNKRRVDLALCSATLAKIVKLL